MKSSEQDGYQAGDELLLIHERPTAIILIYELIAVGLARRLVEAGNVSGRDLTVLGFREQPRILSLPPTLTCFRISSPDLGAALTETLPADIPAFSRIHRKRAHKII